MNWAQEIDKITLDAEMQFSELSSEQINNLVSNLFICSLAN